jgi:hypothetical protein
VERDLIIKTGGWGANFDPSLPARSDFFNCRVVLGRITIAIVMRFRDASEGFYPLPDMAACENPLPRTQRICYDLNCTPKPTPGFYGLVLRKFLAHRDSYSVRVGLLGYRGEHLV